MSRSQSKPKWRGGEGGDQLVAVQAVRVFAGVLANCLSQPRCTTFELWGLSTAIATCMVAQPWAEVFGAGYRT